MLKTAISLFPMNIPSPSFSQHSLIPACRSSNGQPAPQKFIKGNSLYHSLSTIHQGPVQQVAKHKINYNPQHQRISHPLAQEPLWSCQGCRSAAEHSPDRDPSCSSSASSTWVLGLPQGRTTQGEHAHLLQAPHSKNILNFEGFSSHGLASQCQFVIELAAL